MFRENTHTVFIAHDVESHCWFLSPKGDPLPFIEARREFFAEKSEPLIGAEMARRAGLFEQKYGIELSFIEPLEVEPLIMGES